MTSQKAFTEVSCDLLDHNLRIDKWLWYARFFKSRSAATRFVCSGKIRINRRPICKASQPLKAGDILTFVWNDAVRVVQVCALGERRGPPPEAENLYEDLSDPPLHSLEVSAASGFRPVMDWTSQADSLSPA